MISKELAIPIFIKDITKISSTQGERFVLSGGKNAHLSGSAAPEGLKLSVENLSELINIFRGQEKFSKNQFQIQIPPNGLIDIQLPQGAEWILSSTFDLKIGSLSAIQDFNLETFDEIPQPSSSIKVQAKELQITPDRYYKTFGVANVFFSSAPSEKDLISISIFGSDVVLRFGEFRYRAAQKLFLTLPFSADLKSFSLGSSTEFKFRIQHFQHKKINPAYVSPEASLWKLENEVA